MTARIAHRTIAVTLTVALAVLARAGWTDAGNGYVFTRDATGAVVYQYTADTFQAVATELAAELVRARVAHLRGARKARAC